MANFHLGLAMLTTAGVATAASAAAARTGGDSARIVSVALAAIFAIGSLGALALAFLLAARNCDEVCGAGPGWIRDQGAWQWPAELALAALATAAAAVVARSLARGLHRRACALALLTTGVWLLWAVAFVLRIDYT